MWIYEYETDTLTFLLGSARQIFKHEIRWKSSHRQHGPFHPNLCAIQLLLINGVSENLWWNQDSVFWSDFGQAEQ